MLKFNSNIDKNVIGGNVIKTNPSGVITNRKIIGGFDRSFVTASNAVVNPFGSISSTYINPVVYDVDALALFSRMTIRPSDTLKALISKTITDLKTAGIWQITDKFHKWDLHTEQASLLDWKNANHNAYNVNAVQFMPTYGLRTTSNSNYLELNFIPSIDCEYATLNDFAFSLDDTGMIASVVNFGAYNSADTAYLIFYTAGNQGSYGNGRPWLYINSKQQKVWNNQSGIKLWYLERPNSTTTRLVQFNPYNIISNTANNSVAMINRGLVLGGWRSYNNGIGAINNIQTSTFWLGKCMTVNQQLTWNNIITYWKANIDAALPNVYGDELNPDPYFQNPYLWNIGSYWSINNGVATNSGGAGNLVLKNQPTLTVGKKYMFKLNIRTYSSVVNCVLNTGNQKSSLNYGDNQFTITANSTAGNIYLYTTQPTTVTYLSVKEIL